jgi:GAF domain-containing protein
MDQTNGGSLLPLEFAAQLSDLARAMITNQAEGLDPARVVRFAAQAVPGSEDASLTLIRGTERPHTIIGTSDLTYHVDVIQYDTGQGPCLEAIAESDVTRADDLATDPQWPAFGPRAVKETGVHSMFGVRLFIDEHQRGALNFYAHKPHAFNDLDLALGAIFAAYASLALQNAAHIEQATNLQSALTSSRQIGSAMGILMARNFWTADHAFEQLRSASQQLHRKLRDIAEEVTHTGEMP